MSNFTRVATTAHELLHGHAMSLKSEHHGVLRVTSGRLYVTTDQSPDDYFLEASETLDTPAGAHVVVETWNQNRSGLAEFEWLELISPHPPSLSQTSAASRSLQVQAE